MMRTVVLSVVGLTLAAGGPAAIHWGREYYKEYDQQYGSGRTAGAAAKSAKASKARAAAMADQDIGETPILNLAEALSMSITPSWVMQRWPRVSTGGAQLQLQGYRVPLVTGTAADDLAGSMTYFFNPQQQLQRIVFYGTTGNPNKLIALLTSQYGFARRVINDPSTLVYEAPGAGPNPKSFLELHAFDVLKQSQPWQQYRVTLVIERPEGT